MTRQSEKTKVDSNDSNLNHESKALRHPRPVRTRKESSTLACACAARPCRITDQLANTPNRRGLQRSPSRCSLALRAQSFTLSSTPSPWPPRRCPVPPHAVEWARQLPPCPSLPPHLGERSQSPRAAPSRVPWLSSHSHEGRRPHSPARGSYAPGPLATGRPGCCQIPCCSNRCREPCTGMPGVNGSAPRCLRRARTGLLVERHCAASFRHSSRHHPEAAAAHGSRTTAPRHPRHGHSGLRELLPPALTPPTAAAYGDARPCVVTCKGGTCTRCAGAAAAKTRMAARHPLVAVAATSTPTAAGASEGAIGSERHPGTACAGERLPSPVWTGGTMPIHHSDS